MEYIVQWYDQATKSWRSFGAPVPDPMLAFSRAEDLYNNNESKITVRVRQEETIWCKTREVEK